ncbi:MAG: tripartite tricarboxylate transporter TctB family protein [Pseudomonadota bacterium]
MTSDDGRAPQRARGDDAGLPADDHKIGPLDKYDGLLAVLLLAICAFFYFETTKFPAPGAFLGENLLPEQFPRMLLYTIGFFAILLPFEHLMEVERWPLIKKSRSAPIGLNTFITIGFMIALVTIATTIGTILTILIAAVGLPLLWGERRYLLVAVYSIAFTAIVTYVFSVVLSVYFEPGVFNLTLR